MVWSVPYVDLVGAYPQHFDLRLASPLMLRGPDILPGWSRVVGDLLQNLRDECEDMGNHVAQVTAIKEDFGRLRVTLNTSQGLIPPGRIFRWLDIASRASIRACDGCGEAGALRAHGGWLTTRCNECLDIDRGLIGRPRDGDPNAVVLPLGNWEAIRRDAPGWTPLVRRAAQDIRAAHCGRMQLNLLTVAACLSARATREGCALDVRGMSAIDVMTSSSRRTCRICGWPVDQQGECRYADPQCNGCLIRLDAR